MVLEIIFTEKIDGKVYFVSNSEESVPETLAVLLMYH